jgi:multidrug efflux system membrane fusion protein
MNDLTPRRDADQPTLRRPLPVPARKPIWRRLLAVAVAFLVVGGLVYWLQQRSAQRVPPPRFAVAGPMPVLAATAAKGNIDIVFNGLGTVVPLATVTVKTQISGQLTRIAFTEGQTVKKGDLLAEIDSRPYERQRDNAQGQLLKDQALLKNAQLDLARYRTLVAQDSIPRQQLDTQDSLVHQLEGTVKSDQALLDTANLNIDYCHIVAPVSGRVGLRQVDAGNYVQLNDVNGIVIITQTEPITAIFTLPEDNLPVVMRRVRAGASLEADAYDRSLRTKLAAGKLTTVDNQIDPTTGTVKLRAQFDNEDGILFPNQFVNIRLIADVLTDATVIPTAAVQRGAPGTFVYLIKPDETVTVRPIQLGPAEGERVAVSSGLAPGDRVVTDGADKLRDGAKIRLRDESGAAPPPAAPGDASNPSSQRGRRQRGNGP